MSGMYLMVAAMFGGVVGFFMEKLTILLIHKRVSEPIANRFCGSLTKSALWIVINSLVWYFTFLLGGLCPNTVECVLVFSACLVLSAVDITIRKIPNELLGFILILSVIAIISNRQILDIKSNLIGLVVGFGVFFVPAYIGKSAGWGDIKFAAVVGFSLGGFQFLSATAIMSVVLIIYTLYLYLSKKGSLKTKVALGPFMAIGFVAIKLLNIINLNYWFLDLGEFLAK